MSVRENQNNWIVCVIRLLEHWCLYFVGLILLCLCFQLVMPLWELCDIWLLLLRTTPGVTLYRSNTGGTFLRLLLVVGWLKTLWKAKLKTKHWVLAIYCRFYLTPFLDIQRVINLEISSWLITFQFVIQVYI